jgi:hypothetical protein
MRTHSSNSWSANSLTATAALLPARFNTLKVNLLNLSGAYMSPDHAKHGHEMLVASDDQTGTMGSLLCRGSGCHTPVHTQLAC